MNDKSEPLFQNVICNRRSVRRFEPGRKVERSVLERIADCGRWAPSGANVQCRDFIVVDEPAMLDAVTAVFLKQALQLGGHARCTGTRSGIRTGWTARKTRFLA